MRLQRIVLENFGPYYGRHDVDLTVSQAAPVVLIHGENERGKTSFANALRWCLYKTVFESDGAPVKTFELMNWEALQGASYNMAVQLEFEHDGANYVLERRVQASRKPTSDQDLEWHEVLRKGGHVQPASNIDRAVRDILPMEISKFFLFDGEMLNHFKVLLRDPGRNAELVKQSIEQILGVPALQRTSVSLEVLRRAAEQRQLQEAKLRRNHERLIADAQQKQNHFDALERDIAHQKEIQQRLEQEREALRERRNQFAEIQGDLRRLEELEAELKGNLEEREETKAEIKELLAESWWIPLEHIIRARFDAAAASAAAESELRARRAELRGQLNGIRQAEQAGVCTTCGNGLSSDARSRLRSAGETLEQEIASLDISSKNGSVLETVTHLRPFTGQQLHKLLVEKENHTKRLAIQAHRLERDAREIRDRVRTDPRAEIADIEQKYDGCVAQLVAANGLLNDTIAQQRETYAILQRLQAQIRALPDANRKLAAEAAVFGSLKNIFDISIGRFRDQLRSVVERHAKEVHSKLTTEPGYVGLKINDQYGLMLVNDQGRDILRRSAGSEQIVALSLITALNRASDREAPVVMDTPLGRLDRGHRTNILRFAGEFGPQVILLVQSGELDRERDLADIRPYLSREYKIERTGASDRSRISPIGSV